MSTRRRRYGKALGWLRKCSYPDRDRGEERDRVADADDLAQKGLCRRTVELIEFVAMDEPVTETDRAPYTVTGPTTTEEFSVRPTFDMVTSSRRIVPAGVPVGARPATVAVPRAPMSAMASHSRMPNAANASWVQAHDPAA